MNKNWIEERDRVFHLRTNNTSYMFCVNKFGHIEHIHYGNAMRTEDAEALADRKDAMYGESVDYDETSGYCLDTQLLEWSGRGRGDYREAPLHIASSKGTTTDFVMDSFEIIEGSADNEGGLPGAYGENGTLKLVLRDQERDLSLIQYYGVSYDEDVITRRSVLVNQGEDEITIEKIMNMMVDLDEEDLVMMTFNGGWSNEVHRTDRPVAVGRNVSASSTGFSSSRTNPGFLLRKKNTTENEGKAWGFNQVYSGSHYASVSMDEHHTVRVQNGISPDQFSWTLKKGEFFATPQTFMTCSDHGLNGVSSHFHDFINAHIVRGEWKDRERPVLVNDWEAFMFDFTEDSIVSLAKQGRDLGAELFVLDDGWFGDRNHDRAGLGDYNVNPEKLPEGIRGLSDRIHGLGMMFGLWFEPEAVNPDSALYRTHPDWAIHDSLYKDIYGRHEMLLDLTRKEVRDYIVENVGRTLDEGNVDYVKWDMNRQMAGNDGAFNYRYICGLYEVLDRIFTPRRHILLESCSSGGNRFDAGMMCFSPQIWTSDDTDAMERLDIQKGCSYLYPQSTMGAHVSEVPNAQTLRIVPITTRFAISAFGVLGYELDLRILNDAEKKECARQIEWYKKHRRLLQFGRFFRADTDAVHEIFTIAAKDGSAAVTGVFRRMVKAASSREKAVCPGLKKDVLYTVETRAAELPVEKNRHVEYAAGQLGLLNKEEDGSMSVTLPVMKVKASGQALSYGIPLNSVYTGSGYAKTIRLPQDFGGELFAVAEFEDGDQ